MNNQWSPTKWAESRTHQIRWYDEPTDLVSPIHFCDEFLRDRSVSSLSAKDLEGYWECPTYMPPPILLHYLPAYIAAAVEDDYGPNSLLLAILLSPTDRHFNEFIELCTPDDRWNIAKYLFWELTAGMGKEQEVMEPLDMFWKNYLDEDERVEFEQIKLSKSEDY